MQFDDILKQYLGEFGRYQKIQYFLVCLPTIFTALHALSWTFTAAKIKHRCAYPNEAFNASFKPENGTWVHSAMQLVTVVAKNECYRLTNFNETSVLPHRNDTVLETCSGNYIWKMDTDTIMDLSAIKQWEIICDDDWIRAFVQSVYYIGQFFGSLVLGPLSDKIGRKKVFVLAILIQITCGASMAYVPWWPLFALLRIGVGFAHPGIFIIAVVIGMELVGPSKRMLGGIGSGMFFASGQVILGVIAYGIRDYRNYQLAISLPAILFIAYWWLVPESARWLLTQRRFAEADEILQRAAKINKRTLPENWYEHIDIEVNKQTRAETKKGFDGIVQAYASLFRTTNMRKRSILTSCVCWPAVSMVYYGLAMNPGFMGGDNRLGFIVGGLIEIPALALVMFTINIVGRKFLCLVGFVIAAVALFLSMILLLTAPEYATAMMVIVIIGKSGLTGVYAVLYIWTPELYPTTVRNTAMGLCSMIARVGATSASFLSMYLAERAPVATCVIFAIMATLAAVACLGLPETAGQKSLETISEAEQFGRNATMFKFMTKNPSGGQKRQQAAQELLMQPSKQEQQQQTTTGGEDEQRAGETEKLADKEDGKQAITT